MNMHARLPLLLLLGAMILNAQDVSGRWSGVLTLQGPNGPTQTQPVYLILSQHGTVLTGSAGNDERGQSAIRNGILTAGGVQFEVGAVSMRLHLNGEALEGTGSRDGQPGMVATVTFRRAGELTMEDILPPLVYEGADRSPRILELRRSVLTRGPTASEDFWKSIRESGAPLVEPTGVNDRSYLVTFLWQARGETTNVLLLRGRFSDFQPENNLLSHIEGTDVWFKTLKLARGSRFQYTFSVNDPRGFLPPGRDARHPVHDPLNSRHLPDDPDVPKDQWSSLLELPGALPQPWYRKRPGVPPLALTHHRFQSKFLNNERDISVYTPPGYEKTASPYPALYLFDGEDLDGLVFGTATIENLIHDRKIPPIVVVRIANPSQAVRDRELGCLPEFNDFLVSELVPFIRRNYNVSADPGTRLSVTGKISEIHVRRKCPNGINVVDDVPQTLSRILRRHSRRHGGSRL